ncbi:MAG: ABC transporter ATP-binding protein, partial [Pseudomonadales bacterium]|nr:ABC transporter ATP-binding protein [Pseudomonadales bacterium]
MSKNKSQQAFAPAPENEQDDAFFRASGIAVGYNGRPVLAGINLVLARGEIGCLLGPSGCGKSTLLRSIAGFETPQDGEFFLGERCLYRHGAELPPEQRNVGMVFQEHSLFPHLDALRNILFGLHRLPSGEARERAMHWLAQVGLVGRERAMPHELSGGEQQRVALARALAPEPALMLLDEPFASLDLDLREKLGRDVRALFKANNTTALLVTHDQQEAFAIADKVGVLQQGELAQWDEAYRIYHQPRNQSVANFVGKSRFLRGEVVDEARVRTIIGSFDIDSAYQRQYNFSVGDKVQVLLRPDDVLHDDHSVLQARVVARLFRGAQFLYTLEMENGEQLLALVPSHHDHAID